MASMGSFDPSDLTVGPSWDWAQILPVSSCLQHHLRFFPLRHRTGGPARLWPTDEAGIVPETEDSPSTAVEPNPVGLVLHVGEVYDGCCSLKQEEEGANRRQEEDRSMMDGDQNQSKFNSIQFNSAVKPRKRERKRETSPIGIAIVMAMSVEIGGGTLSEIYQSAKKLLLRTRDGLEKLERLENAGGIDSPDLSTSVKRDISQIQSFCADMDRLWRSVGAKSQRDLWKRKVEQIAEEAQSLKESLDKYNLRNQKRAQEARERAELLGRANGEGAHVLRIFDDEAQARASVRSSSRMLEEASATGESILRKYAEQRDWLKSAQRKGLDVLNTVGLSNSVLKLIERRNRVDQSIKYAGMILTVVIVVYLIWRWR